jgi:hypothetical protein
MKNKHTPLVLLLFLSAIFTSAQYAPVTSAGIITDAVPGGAVIVPVTVANFDSIGYFSITLRYKYNKVTYTDVFTPNPAFPGMQVEYFLGSSYNGRVVITWTGTGGVTLPDMAHLVDLHFNYIGGSSSLAWGFNYPLVCEYKHYNDSELLIDSPESSYYINGFISDRTAPVTTCATITGAVSGTEYDVPITVTGYTNIGSMYLKLDYDSNVLTYEELIPNSAFEGFLTYSVSNVSGSIKRIVVGWYGGNITLPDNSTIFTTRFTYNETAGNGSYTKIAFYEDGTSCEYADNTGSVLLDVPTANFYHDGLVFSQYAAKAWLPENTAVPPGSPLALPVKTKDFNNISSFNLTFEYDITAMSYSGSYTANEAFSGALTVTPQPPVGSKARLVINWAGPGPLTLADSTTLVTLNVSSINGTTPLTWITGDATSCRFNNALGNALCDLPKSQFYSNGLLSAQLAPLTVAGTASPANTGDNVTIPVTVSGFTGIGDVALVLDYDPGVLTYVDAEPVPEIGANFSAVTDGIGRIIMSWTGTPVTLADYSTLVNIDFTYNGGETTLAWWDIGSTCKYSVSDGGPELYDQPKSLFYINGYVGPNPMIANFAATNTLPQVYQVITLNDLSTGSPTSRNWSITPSTFQFVNGTGPTSLNPQVKFDAAGAYTVTLKIYKDNYAAIKVVTDYIHAGTPGLWTGISSSDWATTSNWHNYQVPGSITGVVVPSAAPNWPSLDGDLNIGGAQCLNITLLDGSQLTIEGDVTILGGSAMTFTGAGTLLLGGDWSNSGTFNCGTGTVEFTGTSSATIFDTGITQTFYRIIVSKPGENVSVQGNVEVVGVE